MKGLGEVQMSGIHGVARYMDGCRCVICTDEQQAWERRIAEGETLRWASFRTRQELDLDKQTSARCSGSAAIRVRGARSTEDAKHARRFERAIEVGDYELLLRLQRDAARRLQGRATKLRRWAAQTGHHELLRRQAEATTVLAEQHLAELWACRLKAVDRPTE